MHLDHVGAAGPLVQAVLDEAARLRPFFTPDVKLIVGDGERVWIHDADLNQVTVRAFDQALSATPAALLSGAGLERDFELSAAPAREGLEWVRALPRTREGGIESLQIGLEKYPGTLVFVSHDRAFLRALSNRVLELGGETGVEAQPHRAASAGQRLTAVLRRGGVPRRPRRTCRAG